MSKFTSLVKKLYYDMRVRFLFVGGLNTIVGYCIDALVCFLFQTYTDQPAALYQAVAIVTGTVLGGIHSYFWNKYFTFRSKQHSWKETGRFALVYLVCFCFSYFTQIGLQAWLQYPDASVAFYGVKFGVLVVQVFASWFGQKYFAFRKKTEETTEKKDS